MWAGGCSAPRRPSRGTFSRVPALGRAPQWGSRSGAAQAKAGFTLVEVILAIGIAIGLLVVVLFFYQQATTFRTQLLLEAERVSAIRLVMERITLDLRSAHNDPSAGLQLSGQGSSLTLVKAGAPSLANWTGSRLGRATFPETDLRRVSYTLTFSGVDTDTNAASSSATDLVTGGLVRTDEPCVESRRNLEVAGRDPLSPEPRRETAPAPVPVSEAIGYLQFRYWDGTGWVDSWSKSTLPVAVEVTLGREAPLEESGFDEEEPEVFRRVIYLPGGGGEEGTERGTNPADAPMAAKEEL
jgi:type II secretory pathway pseudopilin PulG